MVSALSCLCLILPDQPWSHQPSTLPPQLNPPKDPDPDLFHLTRVSEAAKLYISSASRSVGIKRLVYAPLGIDTPDFAVFWDYCSLFQPHPLRHPARTPKQTLLYHKGLTAASIWFGHAHTVTWVHSDLPKTMLVCTCEARCMNPLHHAAYASSGWCWAESQMASTLKPATQCFDIAVNHLGDLGARGKLKKYADIVSLAAAEHPEQGCYHFTARTEDIPPHLSLPVSPDLPLAPLGPNAAQLSTPKRRRTREPSPMAQVQRRRKAI